MRRAFFFFLLIFFDLLWATCLSAQPTSFSGPTVALTFDAPTRSLRAVIGFPGAASFGPALLDGIDLASVAPRQTYGIVFEGGKCLLVSGLNSTKVSTAAIAGITGYPDGVVWSGDGSLAVLYSRVGKWFQAIAGFPTAPQAGSRVDFSSLDGSFGALAVDTPGKQIVLGVSGDDGAIYQSSDGQFMRLASMAKPVSMSFSSDGKTLYALDAATAQVTAASLSGSGFQTLALAGIANPVAIASAQGSQGNQQNRQLLYVAGGSDRLVRVLDVQSREIVNDVPLSFEPTSLDPFGAGSFVLAGRAQSSNPLWLFTSTPQPGAFFVPAVQLRAPNHGKIAIAGRTR